MNKYNRRERGSTILETLLCIGILMIVFFGLIQVFNFAVANMICEYSAFYAVKYHSLGYTPLITRRAARVAAMPASGKRAPGDEIEYTTLAELRNKLTARARDYMQYGRSGEFGIDYEYWLDQESSSTRPYLKIKIETDDKIEADEKFVYSTVSIRNKLLFEFLPEYGTGTITSDRDHAGKTKANRVQMINHSRNYLRSDGYHGRTP